MITSTNGINLIKKWEGCFLKAYHGAADRPGLLTIGYGHTTAAGAPTVTAGMEITKDQAVEILRNDLHKVEQHIGQMVKVPLNQNQFDALVSFTFNVGEANLAKSTLLRRLNAGDYNVADEFYKWDRANGIRVQGLTNRRADEARLWKLPITPKVPVEHIGLGASLAAMLAGIAQFGVHYWPLFAAGAIVAGIVWFEIRRNRKAN